MASFFQDVLARPEEAHLIHSLQVDPERKVVRVFMRHPIPEDATGDAAAQTAAPRLAYYFSIGSVDGKLHILNTYPSLFIFVIA